MSTQAELLGRTTAPGAGVRRPEGRARKPGAAAPAAAGARGGDLRRARHAVRHLRRQRRRERPRSRALPEADGVRVRGRDLVVFKRIVDDGEILGTVYLRADYELYDRMLSYARIAAARRAASRCCVAFAAVVAAAADGHAAGAGDRADRARGGRAARLLAPRANAERRRGRRRWSTPSTTCWPRSSSARARSRPRIAKTRARSRNGAARSRRSCA